MMFRTLAITLVLCATPGAMAQERFVYRDGHGRDFIFPNGDASFVAEVVSYRLGDRAPEPSRQNPANAVGPPGAANSYVSLGCRGQVTLRFNENVVADVPGADLYIFEVGFRGEPTTLEMSQDGRSWPLSWQLNGGTSEVDIGVGAEAPAYRYVRLTDMGRACSDRSAGADINGVGAIGHSDRAPLSGDVLFDVDRHELKPAARDTLTTLADRLRMMPLARIVVEGHTDNTFTEAHNRRLSNRRARAVANFLQERIPNVQILIIGYGEHRPIADNETDAGRAANRRVEIVLVRAP